MVHPARSLFTRTELHVHVMSSAEADDDDLLKGVGRRARSVFVANVMTVPQFGKTGALIETIPPDLWIG